MRRWIPPLLALLAGCTTDGQTGDTDFWWSDGTSFEYDDCFDSPLVGEWADPGEPETTLVIFQTSCGFSETSQSVCPGGAEYDYVTAMSGTVTIRQAGVECANCTYTVTEGLTDSLQLDCGIGGVPTTFVPTDYSR